MYEYDLIVIGAGPGGYTAALRAAQLGKKTAVIEAREAGGTCLNRGCVPTKALLHASGIVREARDSAQLGIHTDSVRVSLPELYRYKEQVRDTLSKGVETLLKNAKIPLIHGKATITAPHTVRVAAAGAESIQMTGDAILIATGSETAALPIEGIDLSGVVTSDQLLEGTDSLPDSVVIIGGGVIGVEFASFYSDLNVPVTILEGLDRLLPNMDRELGQNLAQLLKTRGVQVRTGAMVKRITRDGDRLCVLFEQKGEEGSASGQTVLSAIGRRPYRDGLFAKDLIPETEGKRLKVNEDFQTSIPGIYAIGDVSSRIQLAHAAAAQGTVFAEKLCHAEPTLDLSLIPACIYARPEIASVGLTETDAKNAGIPVKTGKCVMGGNARTLIASPGRSFMKVTANAETGVLLGAVLMCENATDMISELTVAISNHMTAKELLAAIRPHPTFEEALADALRDLCRKLTN